MALSTAFSVVTTSSVPVGSTPVAAAVNFLPSGLSETADPVVDVDHNELALGSNQITFSLTCCGRIFWLISEGQRRTELPAHTSWGFIVIGAVSVV